MGRVEGRSIGEAYIKALKAVVAGEVPYWYLSVHILEPILNASVGQAVPSLEIKHWLDLINVGDGVFQAFAKFQFSKPDSWTGRRTGEDWINGRIRSLLDPAGYYNVALRRGFGFDQLKAVEERLSARDINGRRMHGGSTNSLVCQIFLPHEDLRAACIARPRACGVRCLALLDFKPIGDVLNLMAVWRSQYLDLKAYGNFISLAMLLHEMCQKTGYKPGAVVSTAHKVVFAGYRDSLFEYFKGMGII